MSANEGFALLPIGHLARDVSDYPEMWPALAILPVLILHENRRSRLAFPSLRRIEILAGIQHGTALERIEELAGYGYLQAGGHVKGVRAWRMIYAPYPGELEPRDWIKLPTPFITKGVWAKMPLSVKSLYLVLKSLAQIGDHAMWDWEPGEFGEDPNMWETPHSLFLPAAKLDTRTLSDLTCQPERTVRYARTWLQDNRLIYPTDPDEKPGLMIPHDPHRHAPDVEEALKRQKQESALPRGPALRAFRAMQKASIKKSCKLNKLQTIGN